MLGQITPITEVRNTLKGEITLNLNKVPIFIEMQKMAERRK